MKHISHIMTVPEETSSQGRPEKLLLPAEKKVLLDKMLSKVGDLGLRRRVMTILEYLDIKDGQRVLDLGCGEGFYTMVIMGLFDVEVVAFDQDSGLLGRASRWIGKKGKIRFVSGDISTGLPFESNFFDRVIFSEVLEHLEKDGEALREVRRVLRPGGIAGVTVPNAKYPLLWDPLNWTREGLGLGHFNPRNTVLGGVWSYDHKRLYSPEGIKGLAEEAGFKVLELETLTHSCLPFNYHILRLGKMLGTMLPLPGRVKRSMEKFDWKEEGGKRFDPFLFALWILRWIDSKNDGAAHKSSVSISLKLEKEHAHPQ